MLLRDWKTRTVGPGTVQFVVRGFPVGLALVLGLPVFRGLAATSARHLSLCTTNKVITSPTPAIPSCLSCSP